MYAIRKTLGETLRFMGSSKERIYIDPEQRQAYFTGKDVKLAYKFFGTGSKEKFAVAPPKAKFLRGSFDAYWESRRLKVNTGRYRHFVEPVDEIVIPKWDDSKLYGKISLDPHIWRSILIFANVWVVKHHRSEALNRLFIRSTGNGLIFSAGDSHNIVITDRIECDCKPGTWYLPMSYLKRFAKAGWKKPVLTLRENSVTIEDFDMRVEMGGKIPDLRLEKLLRKNPKYKFNISAEEYKILTTNPLYYSKCVTFEIRKNELWLCTKTVEINLGQIVAPDLVLPLRGQFCERLRKTLSYMNNVTLHFKLDRSGIVVKFKRAGLTFYFMSTVQQYCGR